jgi:hypothetical protein
MRRLKRSACADSGTSSHAAARLSVRLLGLVVCLSGTMLAGCAAHRHVVGTDALPKRDATLTEIQQLLAERAEVGAYRALVTFEVSRGGRSGSIKGTVRYTPPRTFEVHGLDPLGGDLFVLNAEGEHVTLRRDDAAPTLVGTEMIENGLAPWIGSLRVMDVLRVLGASHGVALDPLEMVALERGEDRYTLYVLVPDGGQARLERKILFERTRFLPVSEEWFDAEGSRRMRVEFDQYRDVRDRWRPFLVSALSDVGALRVQFHEIAFDPS